MPTVIDSLLVTIGLDPTAFTKGQKEALEAFGKTKEGAVKTAKDIEAANKRAAESYSYLAAQVIGLFAVFMAGKSLKEFISDLDKTSAAIGRIAPVIGTSVSTLSKWQNAVVLAGGSADGLASSMQGIAAQLEAFKTTGQGSEAIKFFASLGVQAFDSNGKLRDMGQIFEDIGDALDKRGLSTPDKDFWLRQLGFDQGTRLLLEKGAEERKKLLEQGGAYSINEKDSKAAIDLAQSIASVEQELARLGTTILTNASPRVTEMIRDFEGWIDKNHEWIESDIVQAIEDLVHWLEEIPWQQVGKGLEDFAHGADDAAHAVGGWVKVGETLFALWLGSKFLGVLANVRLLSGAMAGAALSKAGIAGIAGFAAHEALTAIDPKDDMGSWIDKTIPGASWIDNLASKVGLGRSYEEQGLTADGRPISKANPLPVRDVDGLHDLKRPLEAQDKGFFGKVWDGITGLFGGGGSTGTTPPADHAAPTMHGGRFQSPGTTTDAPPPPSAPSNSQRAQIVAGTSDAWRSAGMSEAGVAGVLGNIEQESNFDPNLRHPDQPNFTGEAHYAHGLYQEGGDEWNNYVAWLAKNHPGANWQNPAMQSEFAAWNLKTNYPKVWAAMKAAKSPEEAALIYRKGYLKPNPAVANDEHRMGAAKRFYQHPVTSKGSTTDDGLLGLRGTGLFGSDTAASIAAANRKAPLPTDLNTGASGAAINSSSSLSNVSNSSETHIGEINVHTQATDAKGIASDLKPALQSQFDASHADYGIA